MLAEEFSRRFHMALDMLWAGIGKAALAVLIVAVVGVVILMLQSAIGRRR